MSYVKTDRKKQRTELMRSWAWMRDNWQRRDGSIAHACTLAPIDWRSPHAPSTNGEVCRAMAAMSLTLTARLKRRKRGGK